MAENKDSQAAFMEAVGSIKEYAKVNGNIVTRVPDDFRISDG